MKGVIVHVDGDTATVEILDEQQRGPAVTALLAAATDPLDVQTVTHLSTLAYRVPATLTAALGPPKRRTRKADDDPP